jgi:hypothetical protein
MPFRFRRERQPVPDARRRQVVGQAVAVLAKLPDEGQPPAFIRSLEPFVELAPEVLALGPAPASLTMRVLYGLSVFEGEARQRFEQTMREEFAGKSPTLRAVLRSGLVELDAQGQPRLQEPGRALFRRLREAGAFSDAD